MLMTLSDPLPVLIVRPRASLYDVVQPATSLYGGVDRDARYARRCVASCVSSFEQSRCGCADCVVQVIRYTMCCFRIVGSREERVCVRFSFRGAVGAVWGHGCSVCVRIVTFVTFLPRW
jgi:hypothetical protein